MYTLWNVFLISTSLKLQIFTFLSVTTQIGKFFITNLTISQATLFIMESYNWFPIAPSPVASHTRAKIRVVFCLFFCMVLPHGPSVACCHCGVCKNCSYMYTVHVRASLQPYTKVLAIKKSPTEQDVTIIRLHQLF